MFYEIRRTVVKHEDDGTVEKVFETLGGSSSRKRACAMLERAAREIDGADLEQPLDRDDGFLQLAGPDGVIIEYSIHD